MLWKKHRKMVSEWVIRNGLYWISTIISWKLKEDEQNWLVSFETFNDEVKLEFEQILNDSRFREKLQVHTGEVRTLIIDNVLRSINLRLAQWIRYYSTVKVDYLNYNVFLCKVSCFVILRIPCHQSSGYTFYHLYL